jgi:hypothetical protein
MRCKEREQAPERLQTDPTLLKTGSVSIFLTPEEEGIYNVPFLPYRQRMAGWEQK